MPRVASSGTPYVRVRVKKGQKRYETYWQTDEGERTTYRDHRTGRPFRTALEAFRYRERMLDELARNADVNHRRAASTFGDFAAEWFEDWSGERLEDDKARPQTVSQQRSLLEKHVLGSPLARMRLRDVRHSDVVKWKRGLRNATTGKKLAPSTARQALLLVKQCFDYAVTDRVLTFNPAAAVSAPEAKKRLPTTITRRQVEELAAELDSNMRARVGYGDVIRLMARTGMRPGEARGLRAANVIYRGDTIDVALAKHGVEGLTQPGLIAVAETLTTLDGRVRDDEGNLILGETKTDSSERHLPIPAATVRLIARHIAEYGLGEEGLIFATRNGTAITSSTFDRPLRRAVDKLGLEGVTAHSVRHSARAFMAEELTPLETIGNVMGHSARTIVAEAGLPSGLATTLEYGRGAAGLEGLKAEALERLAAGLDEAAAQVVAEARGAEVDEAAKAA